MRKGFTDSNSKEMEVVLKIRVPQDFDETLEARIDEALADALYNMGCELVDSKEYRDASEALFRGERHLFGLDDMRAMIQEEIALNGVSCHGLTEEESQAFMQDEDSVDLLAEYMDRVMYRVDGNEHRALELVFEQNFSDVLKEFRQEMLETLVDGLGMDYAVEVDGGTLFVDGHWDDDYEIFLGENEDMYCQLPDEDEPRPLKDKIEDVREGDAFFFGNSGLIRTTSDNAYQNKNEPDAGRWCIYGDDGEVYFEDDIGSELGQKVRELLVKLPKREMETIVDAPKYPLRNYDDAVKHLCEVLNEQDWAMDLEGDRELLKIAEFVPVFKSENYFGIYVWHDEGNEYYLVDRNNGEHKMVLSDSFEFVGKNTLDCMKDEKVLHVANMEWMRYLVDFSLGNVQGIVPEEELRGIAVLEGAMRDEAKRQGHYIMGPSLAERLQAATECSAESMVGFKSKGKDCFDKS